MFQAEVTASAKVLEQQSKLRQLKTKTRILGKIKEKGDGGGTGLDGYIASLTQWT